MTVRTSEGTNQDYTCSESLCCKSTKPDLPGDCAEALALILRLAQLRDERIGRVRDDSANDIGQVTGRECNAKLRRFAVRVLRFGEDVRIEVLHNLLETEELGHRVRDLWTIRETDPSTVHTMGPHLTGPQRNEGAEGEVRLGTCAGHFRPGSTEGNGEGANGVSLDLDFGHLEGAERDVGEELGASRAGEPDGTLVLLGRWQSSCMHL